MFKPGDLVRAKQTYKSRFGNHENHFTEGCLYEVTDFHFDGEWVSVMVKADDEGVPNGITYREKTDPFFELASQPMGVPPSIADELTLKPQARKILAHLKKGLSISPLEAQTVYGVFRLAASIFELRQAGYKIRSNIRQDEAGHKYARYALAGAVH